MDRSCFDWIVHYITGGLALIIAFLPLFLRGESRPRHPTLGSNPFSGLMHRGIGRAPPRLEKQLLLVPSAFKVFVIRQEQPDLRWTTTGRGSMTTRIRSVFSSLALSGLPSFVVLPSITTTSRTRGSYTYGYQFVPLADFCLRISRSVGFLIRYH